MKRVFIALLLVATLVAPIVMTAPSTPVAAKTKTAGNNKKLWKQLRKNEWSAAPNPDSKIATRGYALYSIYCALMEDGALDDFYWNDDMKDPRYGREDYLCDYKKIVASSKKQKKGIEWMLRNGAYDELNYESGDVFQGKDQISRVELVNMFASVILRFYPSLLETLPMGTTYVEPKTDYGDSLWHRVNESPFKKGIIVGNNLKLQEFATVEDVKRAVKNFKLVIANRIHVVYRDEPLKQTDAVVRKEVKQLLKYFDSLGIEYYQPNEKRRCWKIEGNLGSSSEFSFVDDEWIFYVSFGGFGEYQRLEIKGEEVDIVKTIKRIFSIRYEKL